MDGFIPLGSRGKKDLQLARVFVHLTSLPSDLVSCLDQPHPPLRLPPLHNSLLRYSLPLFGGPSPFLVPPGANQKENKQSFNVFICKFTLR